MADIQELREGNTLEIPLSYEVYRDVRQVRPGIFTQRNREDVRISPMDVVLEEGKAGDSGILVVHVTAIADQESEAEELIRIGFVGGRALAILPNEVSVRILDAR